MLVNSSNLTDLKDWLWRTYLKRLITNSLSICAVTNNSMPLGRTNLACLSCFLHLLNLLQRSSVTSCRQGWTASQTSICTIPADLLTAGLLTAHCCSNITLSNRSLAFSLAHTHTHTHTSTLSFQPKLVSSLLLALVSAASFTPKKAAVAAACMFVYLYGNARLTVSQFHGLKIRSPANCIHFRNGFWSLKTAQGSVGYC